MNFRENIRSSLHSIFSHKVRTSLTLIGITIGVMAVILMFSTIYGIKNLIAKNMEGIGWNNSIMIVPSTGEESDNNRTSKFYSVKRKAKPLTLSDYIALRKLDTIKETYGMIESWERNRSGRGKRWTQLRGTNVSFFQNKSYPIKDGRFFNAFEDSYAAKVCIIGYYYAKDHFPSGNALDKEVIVGKNSFKVIGILDKDNLNKKGFNFNSWERKRDLNAIYIPLSTASQYLRSNSAVDYIYAQSKDAESYHKMKNDITHLLLAKHKMAHDFSFNDIGAEMLKVTKEIEDMMKKWSITLMIIAGISLFVGGIGLFSTLLISISERMMEIGIRKSIGASERDVFGLFLSESLILSIIAAVQGIFISWVIVTVASSSLDFDFVLPINGVFIGIGFSLFIGFVSGIFPAYKASKIDPIKAIYYLD